MTKKTDLQAEMVDLIVEAMERGTPPWRAPWTNQGHGFMPLRVCGTPYRGINVFMLWMIAQDKGYTSPFWMTFNQAKKFGAKVRKGSKSTKILHYSIREVERNDGSVDEIPVARAYSVFNADQIDDLPDGFSPNSDITQTAFPDDVLDEAFAQTGATLLHSPDPKAYYRPGDDVIHMPNIELFDDSRGYYATLAHEAIHWTGHKSRLDRLQKFNDTESYAFEELVAELGSSLLCAQLGLEPRVDESAAYLSHWIKALKDDKRMLFKAASAAQKATDHLLGLMTIESDFSDPLAEDGLKDVA